MKTKMLAALLICTAAFVSAQNVQTEKIGFVQTLYPKQPLPANVKNYSVAVSTPYLKDDSSFRKIAEDKYEQEVKNYPNTVAESEKNYNEVILAEYEQQVKDAKEKYKLESDEFNKMTMVERLALADKKPVLQLPQKPVYQKPPMPVMESINTSDVIIFNPETLAKTYINLSGYGNGNDGVQIAIDFKGFEYKEPVAAVVDVENFNPQTKEKFITKQTQFVTQYRHPVTLSVKAGGKELQSGVFKNTAEFQSKTSSSKPERIYIERQAVESALTEINDFLNDLYGYPKISQSVALHTVKNKKGMYDDVEEAYDFAKSGYKNYEKNQEEALKDIENAIVIWEKAITEANYDDNKARIDKKVATALLENLIFATILTNQFDKAAMYMAEYGKLRLSYDEKQFLERQEAYYANMKSRFKA